MDENNYIKKIAQLETMNDQLQTEFNHLNDLLIQLGFDDGITTLKEAAKDLLENKKNE